MIASSVRWWVGAPLLVLFLGGGTAFWITLPDVWIGQIWVVVGVVLLAIFALTLHRQRTAERIARTGIHGTARILEMTQTGVYVNNQPQVKLRLRVEAPGIEPYEVRRRMAVPHIALARLSAGTVGVAIDPDDHENVVLTDGPGPGQGPPAGGAQPVLDVRDDPELRAKIAQALGRELAQGEVISVTDPVDVQAVQQVLDEHRRSGSGGAAPSVAGTREDALSKLERLSVLHQNGALTDEEFAREKRGLLRQIS